MAQSTDLQRGERYNYLMKDVTALRCSVSGWFNCTLRAVVYLNCLVAMNGVGVFMQGRKVDTKHHMGQRSAQDRSRHSCT